MSISLRRVIECLSLLLILCWLGKAQAIEVVDDVGKTIQLQKPATRIITLAPSLTELVFYLGAGSRIVATVHFSNYPAAAKKIPRLGSSANFNLEAVLGYHPDLVLAWKSGNNPQQLLEIERLGIPVYRSDLQRLRDIPNALIKLGKLLGNNTQATAGAHHIQTEITKLQQRYAHHKTLSGFYQIWDKPIYTINGKQIISDVMRLCGVKNIFADAPITAPSVSLEAVLARDPQMIISGGSAQMQTHNLSQWRTWSQLTAVRANNLFYINADLMQRATPRILEGAKILCRQADEARRHLWKKKGQTH